MKPPLRSILFTLVLGSLAAAVLLAPGCVEICAQRIVFRYDAGKDQLEFLIFYDGVSNRDKTDHDGAEQLAQFIKNGEVMFFDWPFHLKREDWADEATNTRATPEIRALARAAYKFVDVQPIGHYRDNQGRIGGAQVVTISKATDFLVKVNAAVNQSLAAEEKPLEQTGKAAERIKAAAKKDHAWFGLEGQSLTLTLPLNSEDFAVIKKDILKNAALEDKDQPDGAAGAKTRKYNIVPFLLASGQWSVDDRGDKIVIRLGNRNGPSEIRAKVRDRYDDSLEKMVEKLAPTDIDRDLALHLIASPDKGVSPQVRAIADWGPIEQKVGALVSLASDAKAPAADRAAAIAKLREIGERWGKDHDQPPAPDFDPALHEKEPTGYLEEWRQWQGKMMARPVTE